MKRFCCLSLQQSQEHVLREEQEQEKKGEKTRTRTWKEQEQGKKEQEHAHVFMGFFVVCQEHVLCSFSCFYALWTVDTNQII